VDPNIFLGGGGTQTKNDPEILKKGKGTNQETAHLVPHLDLLRSYFVSLKLTVGTIIIVSDSNNCHPGVNKLAMKFILSG